MSTLYTLGHSANSIAELQQKLAYLQPGTSLLLYQDAVVLTAQPRFAHTLAPFTLYVLLPDCEARGIVPKLSTTQVDYKGFVQLTLQHDTIQAW